MKLTDEMKFVWDFFKRKGITRFGVSGLMGNLYAESEIKPNKLEQLCINRYAQNGILFTDATYTLGIDNGSISKDEFLKPIGKHYGYGLAQWTTECRKSGLYDLCKSLNVSISDLKAQCEYLYSELENGFKQTLRVLKTASDINTASDYVLLHFEMPAQAQKHIQIRRRYSKEIYELMGGDNVVIIGSARIDENGHASGGQAGDQTGKEVSTQNYYLHEKGWVVVRAIEPQIREAIARDMEWACANNNIGYDQNQNKTLYDVAKPVGFNCSLVGKPCETDCGRLVRVCVLYAGVTVRDFYTGDEVQALLDTGAFEVVNVPMPDGLMRGDILVTKTKGHTAVVLTNGDDISPSTPSANVNKLGWVKDGTNWYYRVADGVNAHGWKDITCKDGNIYRFYFDEKGKMQTGWQYINDAWYFFHDVVGSGLEGALYISDKDGKQYIAKFNN